MAVLLVHEGEQRSSQSVHAYGSHGAAATPCLTRSPAHAHMPCIARPRAWNTCCLSRGHHRKDDEMKATELLKKQHREVEDLFEKFTHAKSNAQRREIFEQLAG